MIEPGSASPPGATCGEGGVNFSVYSGRAEAVDLCLFGSNGREAARAALHRGHGGWWYGFVPGCAAGQAYGYRAHGPWAPDQGLRFNPAKLLLDPYARRLSGRFRWSAAVFDFDPGACRLAD